MVNLSTPAQNGSNAAANGIAATLRRSTGTAATVPTNYNTASNQNDFWVNPTAGTNNHETYVEGTATYTNAMNTFAQMKSFMGNRDQASFGEDINSPSPKFLSTTGSSANFLHIDTTVATQIESGGGSGTGITDDYDGNARNGSTPDVGADEFSGIGIDLTAPAISYTTLGGGVAAGTRSFTGVTITDATGVNITAGTRPRVYYKKTTDTNNVFNDNTSGTVGWKFAEANGAGNTPFDFTIDYSRLSGGAGVSNGDVIQYFVVAQDTVTPTPNVGINSGTFAATPSSVALTATAFPIGGTINTYTIVASISGTKTVCASGCDYNSLTNTSGVFDDINAKVVVGNLLIQIAGDLTAETGSIALNPISEDPPGSNFTIKIFPTTTARLITSTTAPAGGFIRLNAADRVTIDGSLAGTGTDRSMTITDANTSATSAVVWLQSNGTDGATSNTIKNLNVVGNSNTTTLIGIGMGATGTSSVSTSSLGTSNNSNTIQNNNISKTQYGIYSQGASAASKNTGNIITQNLINTASPNNVRQGGVLLGFENNISISFNIVDGISSASDCFGIAAGLPSIATATNTGNEVTNATISRNIIGTVVNTGAAGAAGITLASATSGTTAISNNVISGVGGTATPTDFNAGLILGGGTGSSTNVYFNSISMTGTFTGSSPIFAIAVIASNPVLDIRDNVFYTTQTTTSGVRYAIGLGYPSPYTNLTINGNDYFTSTLGTAGSFATSATANSLATPVAATTLAAFKTATSGSIGNDVASLSLDPLFNSTTNLQPQLGSPVLDAGVSLSGLVTPYVDITGSTRVDPPSMGAYEVGVDLVGPTISYTILGNTTSTSDRPLVISATDPSGVPITGTGLPVLYFRKGVSGAYSSNQCTFGSGSTYNCTFTYASVGGVVAGDTIQYFVAAQDSAGTPNVSVNPATGASGLTANPPAAGTPPTAPNSYVIATALTGIKTVCASGCDYTTLTGATGAFNAINTNVVTGNLQIQIAGDLTTGEDGSVALNPIAEQPTGSNFTVSIYPTGTARAITSTTAPAGGFLRLNAADRITLDGSLGGIGIDRSLTITEANTGSVSAVVWLQSNGSDGAASNTIKNCNIVGNANTTTLIGIGMGSSTVGTSSLGTGNNSNTIQNNNISKTQYGIYSQGASAASKNTGNVITGNLINTASPNNVAIGGILVGFEDGVQVTGNNISGILQTTSTATTFGIELGWNNTSVATPSTTGDDVTNAIVSRNFIGSVQQTNTTGYTSIGIWVASFASGTNQIDNNMLSGVLSYATSGDLTAGIFSGGVTGTGSLKIYYNSVSMTGARSVGTSGGSYPSFCLAIGGTNPLVDARNNIFFNTQTSGNASPGSSLAIGLAYSSPFTNLTSDRNDLFVSGAQGKIGKSGSLSQGSGTEYSALTDWQTGVGKDASSKNVDPLFVSATNLHLQAASTIQNQGVSIAGITTDIDGDLRSSPPDIGADEFNTAPTIAAVGVTRQQGSPVSNSTIANVTDAESGNGAVVVTVTSPNPSNGVTVSNIVNSSGTVTADVVASCSATTATFTLQASDGSLTSTDTLTVTVTANTAPTLTYGTASGPTAVRRRSIRRQVRAITEVFPLSLCNRRGPIPGRSRWIM